ncbi:DUF4279 domain-containing protein [Bacillus salipaludis]|uniref:DUF4279 domain-containing protein n=1 Tax=Bacillus salipaludis TaxID=2547811 RepID=A0AA90TSM0_9BACI|nr:DUF4279 domain-containing protein [Bacillus salipaludis]MDQ6597870.1 DUF4279 domain-containing protein [Bacillus salipaludis]
MGESFVAGSFNFIIRGVDLVPDEITKKLNLKPSSVKRKGELLTKDIKMKDSYWSYKVKFKINEELNQALEEFLDTLLPYKAFISEITEIYDAYIYFGLSSNLGQLGFELHPETLQALADLKIRFEVHIISYGEVEN